MLTIAAKKQARGHAATGNEAKDFVKHIRELTETQFDFWIGALNDAAAAMQADVKKKFDRDDRQKTISYWYLLMFLLELYTATRNPFEVKKGETWASEALISMEDLTRAFEGRYMDETVRRYVFDLKARRLIVLDGRGADAQLRLTAPAIRALAETIRRWIKAFRKVDARVRKMTTI